MASRVGGARYGDGVSTTTPYRIGPADLALAVIAVPPTIAGALSDDGELGAVDVGVAVLTVVLVLLRRRAPITVLVVGTAALVASTAVTGRPNGLFPAIVLFVFAVSVRNDRRTAVGAGVLGFLGLAAAVTLLAPHGLFGPEVLAALGWPALAVAAGDVIRNRREAIAAAEDRARRAEETREEEARRRVAEERLRIARELHDVVAHRMAVVNVQAGVAAHLMRSRPDDAAQALSTVRGAAQQALDELAGILSVLREPSDDAAPTEPAPTLGALGALVDSFADAGLAVTWTSVGSPRPMREAVELAIYRTVQESLTNAHKHGQGSAELTITHADDGVQLEVVNAVGERDVSPGSGFGMIGMRERAQAVGGSVDAGPIDAHRFRVLARFPVEGGAPR